jgi:hypothetical protein
MASERQPPVLLRVSAPYALHEAVERGWSGAIQRFQRIDPVEIFVEVTIPDLTAFVRAHTIQDHPASPRSLAIRCASVTDD